MFSILAATAVEFLHLTNLGFLAKRNEMKLFVGHSLALLTLNTEEEEEERGHHQAEFFVR